MKTREKQLKTARVRLHKTIVRFEYRNLKELFIQVWEYLTDCGAPDAAITACIEGNVWDIHWQTDVQEKDQLVWIVTGKEGKL